MPAKTIKWVASSVLLLLLNQRTPQRSSHQEMLQLLTKARQQAHHHQNSFSTDAQMQYCDSLMKKAYSEQDKVMCGFLKARAHLMLGEEEKAIELLEGLVRQIDKSGINGRQMINLELALAYLRLGERSNCVIKHSSETCIFPIQGAGVHTLQTGSRKAIQLYQTLLATNQHDLEYRWLLNLAYMTLGEYQGKTSLPYFIPGLDHPGLDSANQIKPFEDIASHLKLDVNNMAGGSLVEDFDNDGYLDLVTSGWGLEDAMHYFKNNGDGTFLDLSEKSRLKDLTGGLNIMQTDYNNDGYKDIFVLRGAWLQDPFGKQPNSLLKNNGDGTFTDVTTESGLLSFHPTQTATWNDFNNDGWLDVFIGNESSAPASFNSLTETHPCELYLNNKNGTFTNVATQAGCAIVAFVKGVTSGDYNNDGRKDLFISTMDGNRYLLKNMATKGNVPLFDNVTILASLDKEYARTFPTWFWDYDNDGWLDILVCDYTFSKPLSFYAAAEALKSPIGNAGVIYLYKNNQDGTFSNVTEEVGLNKTAFAMGANFGDIDNDGFLDIFLGTGNPKYESLVPNKLFKSVGGKKFADVTLSARVGNLQKGHGVSFADMDNDGDQDIHVDMSGAYVGDAYPNSFYLNPGQQAQNKWICLDLVGTRANRAAVGARIQVTFRENGITRSVYRDVNSGAVLGLLL